MGFLKKKKKSTARSIDQMIADLEKQISDRNTKAQAEAKAEADAKQEQKLNFENLKAKDKFKRDNPIMTVSGTDTSYFKDQKSALESQYFNSLMALHNKVNPTAQDSGKVRQLGEMAGQDVGFLEPKEQPSEGDAKYQAVLEKLKNREELSVGDSTSMYNAPIHDKNVSTADVKRFKPKKLRDKDEATEKKETLKKYKEEAVDLGTESDNDAGVRYWMKDEDGKKVFIEEEMWKALNRINLKRGAVQDKLNPGGI